MLLTNAMADISLMDAGIYALLGYGVVFVGLILLMFVLFAMGKAFVAAEKKQTAKKAASASEKTTEEAPKPTAPGSAGQLKLNNVDPKTAALLMAIVADKLQKPINELRFISMKEVSK